MASPSSRTARSGSTASSARARPRPCGCRARRPDRAPRPTRSRRPERRRGDARSLRILLVDDHPEVRDTTAALLEEFGHHVTRAANGIDALAQLKAGQCTCDLVISDYAMPNLSGTEFLRQVRELCPGIPALIITGYADKESLVEGLNEVEVLLKPFTPSALEAAIGRISEGETTTA